MNENGKNEYKSENQYALVTAFGNIPEIKNLLDNILKNSKAVRRAGGKPMAVQQDAEASHVTNRGQHMDYAKFIAEKMARRLGLNEIVASEGMAAHDMGHTSGGHEGERLIDTICLLLEIGHFKHPAAGVNMFLAEDVPEKILRDIPGIENMDKLQVEKIREDIWYLADVIISHNGEATSNTANKGKNQTEIQGIGKIIREIKESSKHKKDFLGVQKKVETIKDKVLAKVQESRITGQDNFTSETLESKISRPSDVIAYIKTDLLDAFTEGVITHLDNEFLEVLGTMLGEERQERNKKEATLIEIDKLIKTIKKNKEIDVKEIENLETKKEKIEEKIRLERIEKARKIMLEARKRHLEENRENIDEEKQNLAIANFYAIYEKCANANIDIDEVYSLDDKMSRAGKKIKSQKEAFRGKKGLQKSLREIKTKFVKEFTKLEEDTKTFNEIYSQIMEEAKQKYFNKNRIKNKGENEITSEWNKIVGYTARLFQDNKAVINDVMNQVQKALISDYVDTTKENWEILNSKDDKKDIGFDNIGQKNKHFDKIDDETYKKMKEGMTFSRAMERALCRLKDLNYSRYVQYVVREYQHKSLTTATLSAIKKCATVLVKTGIIRNKLFDSNIFDKIGDKNVKKHISHIRDNMDREITDRDRENSKKHRESLGIRKLNLLNKATSLKTSLKGKLESQNLRKEHINSLYKSLYEYTRRQSERFVMSVENIYYGIPNTIMSKIEKALSEKPKVEDYLKSMQLAEYARIRKDIYTRRNEFVREGKTEEEALSKAVEAFYVEERDNARENFEEKLAQQMVIDYFAGMTDNKLAKTVVEMRTVSKRKLKKQRGFLSGSATVMELANANRAVAKGGVEK